jgi:hypothetical protein
MRVHDRDLGKLVAVYGPAPAFIQRAAFVTVLSFLFFLATMLLYYVRQSLLFFLLASGFLVLYLISMFSFMAQKKHNLTVYENGLSYKKRSILWSEISDVHENGTISLSGKDVFSIPGSLYDNGGLISYVKSKTA